MATQTPRSDLVTFSHPKLVTVQEDKAVTFLDTLCRKHGLFTREELVLSLMHQMELKPQLQECTSASLYQCTVLAAEKGMKFGREGIYLVPRKIENQSIAVPVVSYVAKRHAFRDKLKLGDKPYIDLVHMPPDTYKMVRNSFGEPESIEHNYELKDTAQRTPASFVGAYAIVKLADGGRKIFQVTKETISRHREMTSSRDQNRNIIGAWVKDWESMVRKTVEHIVYDDLLPAEIVITDGNLGLPAGTVHDAQFQAIEEEEGDERDEGKAGQSNTDKLHGVGQSPKPLPAFADLLPPGYAQAMGQSDVLTQAKNALETGYAGLKADPKLVGTIWREKAAGWGETSTAPEQKLLGQLKNRIFLACAEAGLSQE